MRFEKRKNPSFLTRIDVGIIMLVLASLTLIGVAVKFVFQQDKYVVVEFLASGGEWWWSTPPPYYWNTANIAVGSKEYDAFKKPIVEILDVVQYGEDDRRYVWMKARIRVKWNRLTREYIFKQESLQIGKTLHIAPDKIYIISQVVAIEGVGSPWSIEYMTLTGKIQKVQPWKAETIGSGMKVVDNKGDLVAEILESRVEGADITTTTWLGEPLHKKDPILKDVFVKLRLRVARSGDKRFFNYYQRVGVGSEIRITFPATTLIVNVMRTDVP